MMAALISVRLGDGGRAIEVASPRMLDSPGR
jgi:hypothetical protein